MVASAGAGKTFVLVERYLRHVLEEGIRPDAILTITFTKKAAAEMKARIVRALRDRGRYEDAQVAETGPVQTIHSFCERVLRENALEAGLDPEFEILPEAEASRLTLACVREALASSLEDEPHAEALVSFLAGQRGFGDRSPYARLESGVESVLRELRSSGFTQLQVRNWHDSPSLLQNRWEEAILADQPEDVRAAFANVEAPTFQERLAATWKSLRGRVPTWVRGKPDLDAEADALAHACGLVQLACAAWWRLDREMDKSQRLDFTELESRAVRLVRKSAVTRERLQRQFAVAMIDEAQDVNPLQHQLLDSLGIERQMIVGDDQQSIYGFRQADPAAFREQVAQNNLKLTKNWRSAPGILNFVDLVFGSLWGADYRPMNRPDGPMDFDFDDRPDFSGVEIWRQAAKDPGATASYVRELLHEGVPRGDIAILVRDGTGALDAKRGLDQEGIECRIAGGSERFYTRIEVRDLANALRAVADPHDDFSLLACLRSPMVGLSLDSVALLAAPTPREEDDLSPSPSVADRLPTFEPPLPEDGPKLREFLRWYLPLRGYADRLSAWEVLGEIFARSDYLPALARRDGHAQLLANARKLLTLAAQEPELGPLEYADRIREIQDLRHKEGDAPAGGEDADVVTIMTIHKAKGLEFPVVVLPQTLSPLVPRARDLVVDARTGLAVTKYGRGESLFYKFLTDRAKARSREEELRVLYVGLTRAKYRLCVCLYPPSARDTVSKQLSAVLGPGPLPGMIVRDSMLDLPAAV